MYKLLEQNLDVLSIPSNIDGGIGTLRTMLRLENKAKFLKVSESKFLVRSFKMPGSFYACFG
jgi:hypothetical protein